MVEVTPFFAVPFGFAKLENCTTVNGELRELFLRRAAEGSRYANPRPLTQRNRHVFESEFQVFRWPEPSVQSLRQFCWNHMLQMIGALNGYDGTMLERMLIYCDAWFHITRRGGFFALHNHPNASWSGRGHWAHFIRNLFSGLPGTAETPPYLGRCEPAGCRQPAPGGSRSCP